jgi:hypothetical protein
MITETDHLSTILDKAALLWPELAHERAELLRKVLAEGGLVIESKTESLSTSRMAAIKRLNDNFSGLWPANFNELRKAEWPD